MMPKTFVAQNLKEALSQVKKDLGPEAVILSTQSRRTFKPGSGWPRTEVEVKAATDQPHADNAGSCSPDSHPSLSLLHQLQKELKEMKGFLAQWLKHQGPPAWLSQHESLASLYRRLVDQGLASQIIQPWLAGVREVVADVHQSPDMVRSAALRLLMQTFDIVNPWQLLEKTGPRRWTFLGPAGVGKTTTIAKLAVHCTLIRKQKVGLISLDDQRWGAQDQLAAYSRLVGIPLVSVSERQELLDTLSKLSDRELIFIDTPGQSPVTPSSLRLLHNIPDLEHQLVLSAAFSESNLSAAIAGFSQVPLTSLIITKVDEVHDFSGLFNHLCCRRLPVSFLTTGRRIPEDFEPASRQRLAALLLAPHQIIRHTTEVGEGYEQVIGA